MQFFRDSTTPDHLLPASVDAYTSLTGHLVQTLQTRDDVKHLVSHLCSKNSNPNTGDYKKAIHVLRYLSSTPDVGRVFKSDSTELVAFSDASFANHENGRSAGAFFLSIGPLRQDAEFGRT